MGRRLRAAGLFAGIGGLDLGLRSAGHELRLLCENDSAALAVLGERFAGIPIADDVRDLDRLPSDVDLIVGGFPCQDLSQAGKTKGIRGDQSNLVVHVFRLLERNPVPWVVLENVPFMLQLDRGEGIRYLVDALEGLGYRWAYRVVDARAFGLPQRRQRVFLIASLEEHPARLMFKTSAQEPREPSDRGGKACGFYWTEGLRGLGWAVNAVPTLKGGSGIGIPSPPAIWFPDGRILTPDIRDAERLQGFEADWTLPAETAVRSSRRWKLVGNAVAVNAAAWVGKVLAAPTGKLPLAWGSLPRASTWPKAGFGESGRRFAIDVSTWPEADPAPDLVDFLKHPGKPLSLRASEGFVRRLKASTLRYPPELLVALERHMAARLTAGDG